MEIVILIFFVAIFAGLGLLGLFILRMKRKKRT
jgi:hypothetical protein